MSMVINNLEDLKNVTIETTKLHFKNFDKSLNGGQLIPLWIKSIIFCYDCNIMDSFDFLPEGLEELTFDYTKKYTLEEISNFPKNLKILHISFGFNLKIEPNMLPQNLEKLYFGYCFNQ